jgi:peroxiredoxin
MKKSIILTVCFAVAALIFTSTTYVEINKNEASVSASSAFQIEGYKIGDIATDFKLKNIDGKMVSLADYPNAKGYIVIFTCNSCPYAVMYEDRIIDLHNNFASKGYPVIAINPNDVDIKPTDSFDNMQKRAKEKGFDFPYLYDEKQDIFPVYGATKTPHVFLLNNKKVVEYIGAIDDNAQDASAVTQKYLENAIAALEKEEKPNPSTTRAVGCSIKFKK